jgi:hypothetical protein
MSSFSSTVDAMGRSGGEFNASGGPWAKKLLHIGSPQAGPKVGAILAIVETAVD